jgi:hypothetical protein
MAGIKARSGPPENQNGFKHGLAGVQNQRANGALSPAEQNINVDSGAIVDYEEQLRAIIFKPAEVDTAQTPVGALISLRDIRQVSIELCVACGGSETCLIGLRPELSCADSRFLCSLTTQRPT